MGKVFGYVWLALFGLLTLASDTHVFWFLGGIVFVIVGVICFALVTAGDAFLWNRK